MYDNMRLIRLLCQEEIELGVSGWDLALHLERGSSDVRCWICWSVSLPATLNHDGGQEEKRGKGERGRREEN